MQIHTSTPTSMPKRRLLRTKEAASYLSMSPWKLRQLIVRGKLPVVQTEETGPFLFDLRDLDALVERSKITAHEF